MVKQNDKFSSIFSPKRPFTVDDLNALLNEVTDEDLLNLPIRSLDKQKLQNSPLLQYIVIRKQSVCSWFDSSFLTKNYIS